ncbi:MAG: carboxylic acid reductase [Spongiibacteraceae bacterium]
MTVQAGSLDRGIADPASVDPKERYQRRVRALAETDPQLRQLLPKDSVRKAVRESGISYERTIATVLDSYADRPALGERAYDIARDAASGRQTRQLLPRFDTLTYRELHSRVQNLAKAWRHHPQHQVAPGEFVVMLGFTSIDFTTAEMACVYQQAVAVPLQTTLAGAELGSIFADTHPATLIATTADLVIAAQLAIEHGAIHSLVAMDYDARDDGERAQFDAAQTLITQAGANITLTTLHELIAFGDAYAWEFLPPHPDGRERMVALLHSSGSTGTPKGAIIPERAARTTWLGGQFNVPMVQMCFAPLNHLLGRNMVFGTLALGGTGFFTARPDMSTLFDDIRLARPTYMNFFPRVFELVHQHFQSEVTRRLALVEANADNTETIRNQVMAEMRSTFLGDRLRGGAISAAPTAPSVREFMRDCFDIMLTEVYGNTEAGTGGITMDNRIMRPPVTEYKLRDVPELGYFVTDKPYPRGELCFKSSLAITSYFKRPEATAKLFDEDGFSLTGDIVEERGPDHVVYIDRRNDVLKLSQGEYVAVAPLEKTFESGSAAIKQIFVYGNSLRSFVLAVVVPDMDVVTHTLGNNPAEAEIKTLIRAEFQKVARATGLRTFEVPRDFIVELEPFSHENGLLSSVRKRMRPNLKRQYSDSLENLYTELERKQREDLLALKNPNSTLSILDKVGKVLEANLGVQGIDVSQAHTYTELGGDSLGAAILSLSIDEIFGVSLPASAILSPTGSPQRWAQAIESALQNQGDVPIFARVHGKNPDKTTAQVVNAADLDLAKFIDATTLSNAAALELATTTRTVLLTGANGFLGRFICLGWLQKLAAEADKKSNDGRSSDNDQGNGKLICLIRAENNAAAQQRLDAMFAGVDPTLEKTYRALADKHLEVLAGDVADARLGLSQTDYDRLARDVDRIVHPAALVNHMLSYENLFGPNVAGTAELIRLALTARKKPIDFVSTVAVTALLDTKIRNDEDSPLLANAALGDGYAAGYATSKWAAEHLLHNAFKQFGLPVNIFRGDMMLAHQTYQGQINASDMFTRLLYSIIATQLAPQSFYKFDADGSRAHAHYDGLPVDVVAATIVYAGANNRAEIRNYNIQNYHHGDGVSFDAIVDWIISAGYPVERVRDHAAWLERFQQKLGALPEDQRQHSSLNVLGSMRRPWPAQPSVSGCDHFKAAVRKLTIGPDVPHLSETFVHKCLHDMRLLGLIQTPQ